MKSLTVIINNIYNHSSVTHMQKCINDDIIIYGNMGSCLWWIGTKRVNDISTLPISYQIDAYPALISLNGKAKHLEVKSIFFQAAPHVQWIIPVPCQVNKVQVCIN